MEMWVLPPECRMCTCCIVDDVSLQVWYGGKTSAEINVHRLVGYVDQRDNHLPLLTVKETLEFALECMSDAQSMSPELQAVTANRVDTILRMIGLSNAADTILGDDLLRGVSGGERKRVTIAEMMMGVYRCLFFGGDYVHAPFVPITCDMSPLFPSLSRCRRNNHGAGQRHSSRCNCGNSSKRGEFGYNCHGVLAATTSRSVQSIPSGHAHARRLHRIPR